MYAEDGPTLRSCPQARSVRSRVFASVTAAGLRHAHDVRTSLPIRIQLQTHRNGAGTRLRTLALVIPEARTRALALLPWRQHQLSSRPRVSLQPRRSERHPGLAVPASRGPSAATGQGSSGRLPRPHPKGSRFGETPHGTTRDTGEMTGLQRQGQKPNKRAETWDFANLKTEKTPRREGRMSL